VNADSPIISAITLFPTDSKSCTYISGPATIPLIMFLKVGSEVNGKQDATCKLHSNFIEFRCISFDARLS